ncbi:MAG: hypothetical protein ACRD5G_13645 [Candidatus Acidiferrales bacterium]
MPSDMRKAVEANAISFVAALTSESWPAAYRQLSDGAKASITAEKFAGIVQQVFLQMAPFRDARVDRIYSPKVVGWTPPSVVCGSSSDPEKWAAVALESEKEQVHVLVIADARNNQWSFALWMVRGATGWEINGFHGGASTLASWTAADTWRRARAEAAKDHHFNSVILHYAALQLAYRGNYFQLGLHSEIQQRIPDLPVPQSLRGAVPYVWASEHDEFRVWRIGPLAVGGDVYLQVFHELPAWKTNQEVDNRNKRLIRLLTQRFPEITDVFAGLVITAQETNSNRQFGTVEEWKQAQEKGP